MTTAELEQRINAQRAKLKETEESLEGTRGVVRDVFRSVLPMVNEQLNIMEEMLEIMKKNRKDWHDSW